MEQAAVKAELRVLPEFIVLAGSRPTRPTYRFSLGRISALKKAIDTFT